MIYLKAGAITAVIGGSIVAVFVAFGPAVLLATILIGFVYAMAWGWLDNESAFKRQKRGEAE